MGERKHILGQIDQFLVSGVIEVRDDRDAVVELEAKGVYRVVHQNHVLKIPILDDSEVFDENAFFRLKAVLAIHPEIDECSFWVDQVDDSVSILLITGSEDADLVLSRALGQALAHLRPQINTRFNLFFLASISVQPLDVNNVLRFFAILGCELGRVAVLLSVEAVGECLIKVEDQRLRLPRLPRLR